MPEFFHRHADADFVIGAPSQLNSVLGTHPLADQQRIEGDAASEGAERDRPAAQRDEIVGEPQAPGAFHVFRHQRRCARMCAPKWRPITRA